jgi:hypothetical protein
MEDGRAILLVAVDTKDVERLRDAMTNVAELAAADRRWEAEVAPDSKNLLHDAVDAYKSDPVRDIE